MRWRGRNWRGCAAGIVAVAFLGLVASETGSAFVGNERGMASLALLGLLLRDARLIKPGEPSAAMPLSLGSSAFEQNGLIPPRHGCAGPNVSPPLAWTGVPARTRSLVLIVDAPDAFAPETPRANWVHWILYNIFPASNGLPEAAVDKRYGSGALAGLNDWQGTGYRGPCPPVARNRYVHTLYALDIVLPDLKQPKRAVLEKAMQGHVLARAQLVGRYQ